MNTIKKHKRIVAVFVIALMTVLVEVCANYPAFCDRYTQLDISGEISTTGELGQEKYKVVFKDEDGCYVRQIQINGKFAGEHIYKIKTKEVNEFGKIEEGEYTDTVNSLFTSFYTNLNKKVKSLTITMKKSDDIELINVYLSNRFEFNKYRMILTFIFLLLLYCALFEKTFVSKVEWYFLAFSLSFGVLIISLAQISCNSWDEQIHFREIYKLASVKNVEWSESALMIVNRTNVKCNTKAEFAQLRDYMDERGEDYLLVEQKEPLAFSYQSVGYLPMAVFLWIGRILNFPFSFLFAFGKMGNLVLYVFVMFWAIRLAKSKKMFLAFIAMMPTTLFQASSYTYDAVVFSFVTLGCVLWCREAFWGEKRYHATTVIGAIFFLAVGCLAKAIYIPLILLLLMLPQLRKMSRKERILFASGILVIFLLVMMTFILPVLSNTVAGNLSYGGDSRGGDTSVVRQLISMVKHPLASVKLMLCSIFELDNFRNLGNVESAQYFFGNLMLLNFSSMGVLGDKWCVLLLPVLTLLLFHEEPGDARIIQCGLWSKVLMWGVFAVIVLLIWSAMYLSFTPVGNTEIAGVQARYYLPLLYLGALLLTNNKIRVQIEQSVMGKIICITTNVFQVLAIYELALKTRMM